MISRKLAVGLLALVLLLACSVSGPVFSGEHPWDAEITGNGGEGGDPGGNWPSDDTTWIDSDTVVTDPPIPDDSDPVDDSVTSSWLDLLFDITFWMAGLGR